MLSQSILCLNIDAGNNNAILIDTKIALSYSKCVFSAEIWTIFGLYIL